MLHAESRGCGKVCDTFAVHMKNNLNHVRSSLRHACSDDCHNSPRNALRRAGSDAESGNGPDSSCNQNCSDRLRLYRQLRQVSRRELNSYAESCFQRLTMKYRNTSNAPSPSAMLGRTSPCVMLACRTLPCVMI